MKTKMFSILLLFFMLNVSAIGQDSLVRKPNWSTRLNIGYCFGGQIYNDNFIYNPGYAIQISQALKLNKHVELGLGTGYTSLNYERFMPIFLEAVAYKKNKKVSPFIRFQFGYSIGWYANNGEMSNCDLSGSYYFNAGLGRKFDLSEKYALSFQWSYCMQFAELNYEIFGVKNYSQTVNYDLMQISISLIMN